MQRALAVVASDLVESELDDHKKRSEMLKIADRMAKLRDPDRLYQADLQRFPWLAVGIFDVSRDPRTPSDPKTGLLWMDDEIALSAGDEVDVCRELAAKGY